MCGFGDKVGLSALKIVFEASMSLEHNAKLSQLTGQTTDHTTALHQTRCCRCKYQAGAGYQVSVSYSSQSP